MKQDFDELLASIREAGKILKEEQRDFSTLVHVSLRTLQNWEQKKDRRLALLPLF